MRALHSLRAFWSTVTQPPAATRVALLNTGELVLLDALGCAQVLSVQTTDVVRDVLAAAESCTVHDLARADAEAKP